MTLGWKQRGEQWERFRHWEDGQLREIAPDWSAALAWMADARDSARCHAPGWDSPDAAEEHWRHLTQVRAALARLRLPG